MNIHKLLMLAMGLGALPLAHAAEFADYGRVVRVEPRVEQVRQPREECKTDYVQAPVQAQSQHSPGGAILGAVVGGIVGNQIGSGSGRAAATAAGVLAGTVAGDRIGANSRQNQPVQGQEQAVRSCRIVDTYESRTTGYNVTYDYRGQTYTSIMDRDPGERIRLRISVEPERQQQYSDNRYQR